MYVSYTSIYFLFIFHYTKHNANIFSDGRSVLKKPMKRYVTVLMPRAGKDIKKIYIIKTHRAVGRIPQTRKRPKVVIMNSVRFFREISSVLECFLRRSIKNACHGPVGCEMDLNLLLGSGNYRGILYNE